MTSLPMGRGYARGGSNKDETERVWRKEKEGEKMEDNAVNATSCGGQTYAFYSQIFLLKASRGRNTNTSKCLRTPCSTSCSLQTPATCASSESGSST